MSVITKLASSLGRRDEAPNQALAEQTVEKADSRAVAELVDNLANKNKNIQSDCIKVLYEIGYRKPSLIAPYVKVFLALLDERSNRLVWGAMIALDAIASERPKELFGSIRKIAAVADSGSVITRDHAVGILITLSGITKYAPKAFPLLIEQLKKCPTNQLPMYAENALPIITVKNKDLFVKTLSSRLVEIDKESKRKRIEKVMATVEAIDS
jgi:hypothetical protein